MVRDEVIKAYKDNDFPYQETPSDINEERFMKGAKNAQHEIDTHVIQVFRLKDGVSEKMYWQELLTSTDFLNNPIDHSKVVGKYDMPVFTRRYNPEGKPLATEVSGHKTIYDIEWDPKRLKHLEEIGHINGTTNFVLITSGRRYGGFSLDEFVSNTFDDLHKIGKFGTTNPRTIKAVQEKDVLEGKVR